MSKHGILPFKVTHARLIPKRYVFTHKFFWFKLDLMHLDSIPTGIISCNKANIYSFWDRDHIKLGHARAKDNYIQFAKDNGVSTEIISVVIYTQLRCLGYVFNPVSFILLTDANKDQYGIIEIGNTFNELKPFFVGKEQFENGGFTFKTKKYFYISPFIDHDNDMTFHFKPKGEEVTIIIDDHKKDDLILKVSFKGQEQDLTPWNLFKFSLKSPLVTLQFIFFIHLHAFMLWLKGIPYFKKDEHQDLQQGVQIWKT